MLRGFILGLVAGLLVPASGRAQDLESADPGVVQAALAGAGVVAVRGPEALWTNPAGLSTEQWQAAALLGLQRTERAVQPQGDVNASVQEARDLAGTTFAPGAALTVPLWRRAGLAVGLGYHTGLLVDSRYLEQSDTSPVRYLGTRLALRQQVITLGAALRWRWIAVGVAFRLSHLRLQASRTLWAGFAADSAQLGEPDMDLAATFDGHNKVAPGGLFGLRLHPVSWLELGFSLRPPVSTNLSGRLDLQPAAENPRPPSGYSEVTARGSAADLAVTLPLALRGGISLHPLRWLTLHLEVQHQRWSTAEGLAPVADDAAVVLVDSAQQQSAHPLDRLPLGLATADRTSFHAGLELPGLLGLLTVRGGYAYHLGATEDDRPAATLLDLNRHVMGLGLEASHGRLRMGLAVQHSFRRAHQATGERAVLYNPLDPQLTADVGRGRYSGWQTRVELALGLCW